MLNILQTAPLAAVVHFLSAVLTVAVWAFATTERVSKMGGDWGDAIFLTSAAAFELLPVVPVFWLVFRFGSTVRMQHPCRIFGIAVATGILAAVFLIFGYLGWKTLNLAIDLRVILFVCPLFGSIVGRLFLIR
ncbi:MAG: hypothetical protein DRJ61_11820 [Acidobacteria bacterium]|nr:MAG: hypothetical protein DRJ61_11820 [Acidobacteriota bacterium]